jgi:capsular polysaccharide transport system permease protein
MLSLLKCGAVQFRVIGALMLRELNTRFGRENIGFLWIVGEPILFCGGVSILWTAIRPPYDNGIPMTAFVITGYVPLTLWRHCVARAVKAFEANGSLLFHRQVTPMDIIVSRVILEVIGTLIAGVIVSMGAIFLGYMKSPVDIGLVYIGFAYQIAFSFASALIISALSEMSELVEKFIAVLMYLSIPFSGAFSMVSWLPTAFQSVVLYSPSVNSIEMIRAGEFGPGVTTVYSFSYSTYSITIMILLGIALTARVRKYIVVQ